MNRLDDRRSFGAPIAARRMLIDRAPNRSAGWRRQLYLSYNARSDGGHLRESHYADFRKFLAGKYAEFGLTDTYYR